MPASGKRWGNSTVESYWSVQDDSNSRAQSIKMWMPAKVSDRTEDSRLVQKMKSGPQLWTRAWDRLALGSASAGRA